MLFNLFYLFTSDGGGGGGVYVLEYMGGGTESVGDS